MAFLDERETVNDVGPTCVAAVKDLSRKLYDNRAKFGGFRRMFKKDVVSALTTSPVEGQIGEQRKCGANAKTQMDDAVRVLTERADNNLNEHLSDAHRELASVNLFSRSPTSQYLIVRGEALICKYHSEKEYVKSARTSYFTWIAWNNFCVEKKHFTQHTHKRDRLFSRLTRMLRVSRLTLTQESDGTWFINCDCGCRENSGVPCSCFFKIADDAGIPDEDVVHLCMVTPKFLKWWQSHYGTQSSIGDLLYEAQSQSFRDKDKGIQIPSSVARALLGPDTFTESDFPILGKETLPSDYKEAQYMLKKSSCTSLDVSNYRNSCGSTSSKSSSLFPRRVTTRSRSSLGDCLSPTDGSLYGNLSSTGDDLLRRLEQSEAPLQSERPDQHFKSADEHKMYVTFSKAMDDAKTSLLENFSMLCKHHNVKSPIMAKYQDSCVSHINSCSAALRQETEDVMKNQASNDDTSSNRTGLKFSGEESCDYVSPARQVRRKGPKG